MRKRVIPPSCPGGFVRDSQEGLNFRICEEINQRAVLAFGGDSQNTLDVSGAAGFLKRSVSEEGADRR